MSGCTCPGAQAGTSSDKAPWCTLRELSLNLVALWELGELQQDSLPCPTSSTGSARSLDAASQNPGPGTATSSGSADSTSHCSSWSAVAAGAAARWLTCLYVSTCKTGRGPEPQQDGAPGTPFVPASQPSACQVLIQGWAPLIGPSLPSMHQGKPGIWGCLAEDSPDCGAEAPCCSTLGALGELQQGRLPRFTSSARSFHATSQKSGPGTATSSGSADSTSHCSFC